MGSRFTTMAVLGCVVAVSSAAHAQDVPLRLFTNTDFPGGVNLGEDEGVALGDYDRDGWVDVFAHSSGNLWRNLNGTSWSVTHMNGTVLPVDGAIRYSASFGDYDNDGFPDILVEPRAPGCAWLLHNEGLGASPPYTRVVDPAIIDVIPCDVSSETVAWGDVDGDADMDLFLPAYPFGTSHNYFWTNQGPRAADGVYTFLESTVATGLLNTTATARPEGAQMIDIDQDGDLDLYSNGILYVNTSTTGVPAYVALTETASGVGSSGVLDEGAVFADIDLDGDEDLIVAYTTSPDCHTIWENRGDATFVRMPSDTIDMACTGLDLGLSAADWDNDGDIDITTREVFRRSELADTGDVHYVVATHPTIPDADITSATPAWGDLDRDGDLDTALGNWFGPTGHIYENTTYDAATPDDQRRYIRVRPLRASSTFTGGLETEMGASAEVIVHAATGTFRHRRFSASGSGYLNENEYAMHFALPPDPSPSDPGHDLVVDVVVDFPTLPEVGYSRVDKFVNPILGNLDLATLGDRQLDVYRDGVVVIGGAAYAPSPDEQVVLHTAAGGLDATLNVRPLPAPTAAPAGGEWVGVDFDTMGATAPVHVRELIVDGALDAPATCGAASGNAFLWDVTDATAPVRWMAQTVRRDGENARTFVEADSVLRTNRRYRLIVHVSTIRATMAALPSTDGLVRVTGGVLASVDPCSGTAVAALAPIADRIYASFRYGSLPADPCDACAPGEVCIAGHCAPPPMDAGVDAGGGVDMGGGGDGGGMGGDASGGTDAGTTHEGGGCCGVAGTGGGAGGLAAVLLLGVAVALRRRAKRAAFIAALLAAASLAPSGAHAQVSLTGDYVRYVSVGDNGVMIDAAAMQSMQYGEDTTGTTSCDLYFPGTPQEGFTVEATGADGHFVASNNQPSGAGIATSVPTALAGRVITWSGTFTSGADSLTIDQTFGYAVTDRAVRLDVVITNTGTAALTDLYYLRTGDPDHGVCNIGGAYATDNDVARQVPADGSVLVTAGAGDAASADRYLVMGMGTYDARARGYTGGFANTDASGEWTAPVDADGANGDNAIDVVFKEPSLAPGASTTFTLFYVWGPDAATVASRFDDVAAPPCATADGTACTTPGGSGGTCYGMRCCTGCWDGTACHPPGTPSACGTGGGTCTDCRDTNGCTADTCDRATAACGHLTRNGAPCDDGLYCTAIDRCDATAACVGTGTPCDDRAACTTDGCDESSHACTHAPIPEGNACTLPAGESGICHGAICCAGCWDGTECHAPGTPSACGVAGGSCQDCRDTNPCTSDVCVASTGSCSHGPAPAGTPCNDTMFCTMLDACDATGACTGMGSPCDDGDPATPDSCDESTRGCGHMPDAGPPDMGATPDLGAPDMGGGDPDASMMGGDGAMGVDMGSTVHGGGGCCEVAGAGSDARAMWLAVPIALLVVVRRRRRA